MPTGSLVGIFLTFFCMLNPPGPNSPHRSLSNSISTPTMVMTAPGRHRVMSNRQPRTSGASTHQTPSIASQASGSDGGAFTPEPSSTSRSASRQAEQRSTPDLLQTQQSSLEPKQQEDPQLETSSITDSPQGRRRLALARRLTEPTMTPTVPSPVFRFPDVNTTGQFTPVSQHEQQPTIVEVYETDEAIYDTPKKRYRQRIASDYEEVSLSASYPPSPTQGTDHGASAFLVDSDSGYSPSGVDSPLAEVAKHQPVIQHSSNQPSTSYDIVKPSSKVSKTFLPLPRGNQEEPHYRAPRVSPANSEKSCRTPSFHGSSPRHSIQSTQSNIESPKMTQGSEQAKPSVEEAGYRKPNLKHKRPPPVPIRDPTTVLSKQSSESQGAVNTFVRSDTSTDSGSPIPIIQIHRPRVDSVTSEMSSCGSPGLEPHPDTMEKIQRGWQRICRRQKLISSRQHGHRGSERHQPALATEAIMQVRESGDMPHYPLTRQKSNPMLAMITTNAMMSSQRYENVQLNSPQPLYRARSSPNLHAMDID